MRNRWRVVQSAHVLGARWACLVRFGGVPGRIFGGAFGPAQRPRGHGLRDLHLAMRNPAKCDKDVLALVDEELSGLDAVYRSAIKSWVPICRAVALRCAEEPHSPFPPTYALRSLVVDEYDMLKGGTDQAGRYIADATRAGASAIRCDVHSKITMRFFYYALLNAYRLSGLLQFFEDRFRGKSDGEVSQLLAGLSLRDIRAGIAGASGTFPDFCLRVGQELWHRRIPLGTLALGAREAAQGPAPVTPVAGGVVIWGYKVSYLRKYVQRRTGSDAVKPVDLVTGTGFVLDSRTFSDNTPGHVIVASTTLSEIMGRQLADAYTALRPAAGDPEGSGDKRGMYRGSRLAVWNGPGKVLRSSILVVHDTVSGTGRTAKTCLVCGVKRKGKALVWCVTCGEPVCAGACEEAFHAGTVLDGAAVRVHDDDDDDDDDDAAEAEEASEVVGGLNFDGEE